MFIFTYFLYLYTKTRFISEPFNFAVWNNFIAPSYFFSNLQARFPVSV